MGNIFSKAEQSLESIGVITATCVMVTNMISTGVFTSLGLQRWQFSHPLLFFYYGCLGVLLPYAVQQCTQCSR